MATTASYIEGKYNNISSEVIINEASMQRWNINFR